MPRVPPRDCPCHSALRYAACCAPYHRGERAAPTALALMRSRYAAYALGLGAYLIETLTGDHPDREIEPAALTRELGRMKDRQRFLGLRIERAVEEGDTAEVLFHARIFERGEDRSFSELSSFEREDGGWRYAGGVVGASAAEPRAWEGGKARREE
jgi:SEC-C motif-containing protein